MTNAGPFANPCHKVMRCNLLGMNKADRRSALPPNASVLLQIVHLG